MKYKRIIAFVCCFVIVFNIVFVSASATGATVSGFLSSVVTTLSDWFVGTSVEGIANNWAPIAEASKKVAEDPCLTSPTGHHDFYLQVSPSSPKIHTETCKYCGVTWSSFFLEEEDGFTSQLEYPTVSSTGLFVIKPTVHWTVGSSIWNQSDLKDVPGGWDFSGYAFDTQTSYNRGSFGCTSADTFYVPPGLYNIRTSRSGYLGDERYTPYASVTLRDSDGDQAFSGSEGTSVSLLDSYYTASALSVIYTYYVQGGWYSGSHYDIGAEFELECVDLYDGANVEIPDEESRISSLMQAINWYNIDNSIEDNSTNVNFFLVPIGEEPTEDTAVSPALYDEETLVYTDPVTGMEYLTNGWTYDYLTRSYTLDMADDTFLIGDTVIDTIKLTYGDELLIVDHYAAGALIQTDAYDYVMVSGSECGLNGHTYNITGTQDPTCIGAGYRTYTCSVCGNQYVEDIPQIDHAYGDFTVEQEATCTAPGITSFSCSTCGGQYTDTIAALGHDWQPTASTEESYVMPDNVSCPDCHGDSFTYKRKDLELKPGKNLFDISQLDVCDRSDGLPWISEVGSDYFIISEVDGYSGNGGFKTPKSLSALAPGLKAGIEYTLSFTSESSGFVYLYGSGRVWSKQTSLTLSESDLASSVAFYGMNVLNGYAAGDCRISNIQIEEGTAATAYEPYDPEYVEIIPPLYTFTCSDSECGTVWTKEAEYQGATVTYTCTRCDATRTEAAGEEAGLFHSIGNLIADGITWAVDKMVQLVDSLSGLNDIFHDFAEKVKSSAGQYPAFLGAVIALLPEDLITVFWFGLVAAIIVAVWKKWFS